MAKQLRRGGRTRQFAAVWERDGSICRYCDFPADTVDHIIPWSYRPDNSMSNLVLACRRCNDLAHDFVFDSFEAKRDYLLGKRRAEILRSLRG